MFAFRFLLGLGIGPKSATIPIYASECAPANVRGALVMMWQVFTAFGIMCGFFCGAAFRSVLRGYQTGPGMFCEHKPGNSSRLLSTTCVSNTLALVIWCYGPHPQLPNVALSIFPPVSFYGYPSQLASLRQGRM